MNNDNEIDRKLQHDVKRCFEREVNNVDSHHAVRLQAIRQQVIQESREKQSRSFNFSDYTKLPGYWGKGVITLSLMATVTFLLLDVDKPMMSGVSPNAPSALSVNLGINLENEPASETSEFKENQARKMTEQVIKPLKGGVGTKGKMPNDGLPAREEVDIYEWLSANYG